MKTQPPPFLPAKYAVADVAAIQALVRGDANTAQQQRALNFIVNEIAGTYDLEYRTDERDHAFASGRRFVGLQIVKMTKLNLAIIARDEPPVAEAD